MLVIWASFKYILSVNTNSGLGLPEFKTNLFMQSSSFCAAIPPLPRCYDV